MRTDDEKLEDIKGLTMAMAGAVKARGPFQPEDMIEASLAMIVVMSEKIGAEPKSTMASLLLAVCKDDVSLALESVIAARDLRVASAKERRQS